MWIFFISLKFHVLIILLPNRALWSLPRGDPNGGARVNYLGSTCVRACASGRRGNSAFLVCWSRPTFFPHAMRAARPRHSIGAGVPARSHGHGARLVCGSVRACLWYLVVCQYSQDYGFTQALLMGKYFTSSSGFICLYSWNFFVT